MRKVLICAVKGGTGKSTTTAGLGKALLARGLRVGFMDLDISGANLPAALGIPEPFPYPRVDVELGKMYPIEYDGYQVFSLAFRFGSAAVLWHGADQTVTAFGQEFELRGTGRYRLVEQMLNNVQFSELDYQLYDLPPSTGEEVLSLFENVPDIWGCILVSQPTNLAVEDMERALDMIDNRHLPLIGMVGNMTEAVCPHCGKGYYPFSSPGVDLRAFCRSKTIPYLLSIPLTPDRAVLAQRFAQLAEIVTTVRPVNIWEKTFKERLESAIVDGMVKGVFRRKHDR